MKLKFNYFYETCLQLLCMRLKARREVGVGDCGKFEERFCMPVVGWLRGRATITEILFKYRLAFLLGR